MLRGHLLHGDLQVSQARESLFCGSHRVCRRELSGPVNDEMQRHGQGRSLVKFSFNKRLLLPFREGGLENQFWMRTFFISLFFFFILEFFNLYLKS